MQGKHQPVGLKNEKNKQVLFLFFPSFLSVFV